MRGKRVDVMGGGGGGEVRGKWSEGVEAVRGRR